MTEDRERLEVARHVGTLLVCAVITLACASSSAAQPTDASQERPRGRASGDDRLGPGQILNMLDAWAMVEAQRTLQISDERYGDFMLRLKRLQQTRRRAMQARNGILQELRRLVGPQAAAPADEKAIEDRLRALRELDERTAGEMRKAYEELDQVLTPAQRARFRLFEEALERRKIDLLKRAQQGAAGRRRQ
jgi:Spy/CpxP family protein refolding chaperone